MENSNENFALTEMKMVNALTDELYEAMMDNNIKEARTAINKLKQRLSEIQRCYKDLEE